MEKARKRFIKCGFTKNGKQLWLDKETGKRSIAEEDREHLGYPDEVREQALKLYLEGSGLRSIARFLGCSHGSVINWMRAAAKRLKPLATTLLEQSKTGIAELDEMWHFF